MNLPEIPTVRPNHSEFKDFNKYISKIESLYSEYGMVKVIPPSSWSARKSSYLKISPTLSNPIKQLPSGRAGVYNIILVQERPISYKDFKLYSIKRDPDPSASIDHLEKMFWKNIIYDPAIYAADSDTTSLFESKTWNLSKLPGILNEGLNGKRLKGINTSFLYVGSWKSMFCWHKEDLDLYSINFLHFGKPKIWYCMPEDQNPKFEELCRFYFAEESRTCREFLRHKTFQVSPAVLKKHGVKLFKAVQNPGEFIVIFSKIYHMGFNAGFNCAEAVNFAMEKWLNIGAQAKRCLCEDDTAFIDVQEIKKNLEKPKKKRKLNS